jgi:hypothetical protein
MVSTGQGEVSQCPTCTYLDASKGDNGLHWGFGVCERCENLGPAEMSCVTCLVSDYNQNTYQAQKKALMMYKEEPTLFTKKEFAVWANYYHHLEEQRLEVDTWNRLTWLEYYDNPSVALESQPCKLVT